MTTLNAVLVEIAKALLLLKRALSSLDDFTAMMREMGWSLETVPIPIQNLKNPLAQLQQSLLPVFLDKPTVGDLVALASSIKNLITAIRNLKNQPFDPALTAANFAQEFPAELLDQLLIEYFTHQHPKVGSTLKTLGIIRVSYQDETPNRIAYLRREIVWEQIPKLLADPASVFATTYGWGTKQFSAGLVYQQIMDLMLALGLPAHLRVLDGAVAQKLEDNVPVPGNPKRFAVVVPWYEGGNQPGDLSTGLRLFGLPKDAAKLPGLALIPYATGNFEQETQLGARLFFTVKSNLKLEGGIGIKLRPKTGLEIIQGLDHPSTATAASGNILFALINRDTKQAITLLGSEDGSGFFYKALSLAAGLYLNSKSSADLFLELELEGGKILIRPDKGDGFLNKILPKSGIGANVDLALGISRERGFYFRGSGGLEINLPTHVSVGPIDFESVTIGIGVKSSGQLPLGVGATVKAQLGPLQAVVQNVGFSAVFSLPKGGGNLGPVDLNLGFKPPTGIGLTIDGGGFKGGGFLRFDPKNERYDGVLELSFQDLVTLKAIGLITTRLPGGKKGFSLLIVITAEFQAVQLGMGFTLTGVGGLLGLNRTAKIEVLRAGIKTNALASVLFPTNIVQNAPRLISDLRQIFPAQVNRFVFGPMAKLGWGTPTLISLELGIIVEVPSPVRIALIGVLRTVLPDEKLAIIRIQVNFMGSWEQDKRFISFDAGLFDSRIGYLPLAGDMAFRLFYGDEAYFLVSIGGFHPAFKPPPLQLPTMQRISINLIGGSNPRLTAVAYFAVTSNTAQLGARLELMAKAWKFNVYGFLAFDALFQFSPFYFVVEISAGLAVRIGTAVLFSVGLRLQLSGPTPWNARGTARFKVLFFITAKVRFNVTWGEKRTTKLPDVDVLKLLKAALGNKNNWQAQLPARNHLLVSLRKMDDVPPGHVVAHPAGTLTVSQKVVPLDTTIDRFGSQRPKNVNRFTIARVHSDGMVFKKTVVKEVFAPAQFEDMTDAQKLSRRSFEKMPAGVRVSSKESDLRSSRVVSREVRYETEIIDTRLRIVRLGKYLAEHLGSFFSLLAGGAVAKCSLSFAKKAEPPLAPGKVKVRDEGYTVVGTDDLRPFDGQSAFTSESGAVAYMRQIIKDDPALMGELQVVANYELDEAA